MLDLITIHRVVVTLFLLIYLIKLMLLLTGKTDALANFTKRFKIAEMIISVLFLATGAYMLFQGIVYTPLFAVKLAAVFIAIPIAIIGFKKQNKVLAILSVALIFGAYGLAEVHKKKSIEANTVIPMTKLEPAQTAGEALAEGKKQYEKRCYVCHGADGTKGLTGAANLQESKMTLSEIEDVIKNGKGRMTAYEGILNPTQIKEVAVYVKELQQ